MRNFFKTGLFLFLISTLPFVGQFHLPSILALGGLLFLSIFYEKQSRVLSKGVRAIFLISYLILLYLSLGNLWGLEPGVSLLSFLALLKSFELDNRRDLFIYTLIIELSLIGHLLSVDDLYMVLILILIVLNLFWLLYQFHTFDDLQRPPYTRDIGYYRKKIFVQVILWSIPLAISMFFVFPRIPLGNLFMNTLHKKTNLTGFTHQLRPGEISQVIQSNVTYFRAQFKNLYPASARLYWRGMVLSHTDGFNWDRVQLPPRPLKVKVKGIEREPLYNYSVEYDFFSNGPLFLLDRPVSYKVLSRSYTSALGAQAFYTVAYRNQKIRYQAAAINRNTRSKAGEKVPQMRAGERKIYLDLSKVSMGVRFNKWLEGYRTQLHNPEQLFSLMQDYFSREGFRYSLSPGRMNHDNPLDDFFFNRKVGLCEHYASLVAYALRRLGHPSRIVVGFQGGEYNPYGEYYSVQGKNAHSWVEYWRKDRGWQRVDPTSWILPDRIRFGADIYFLEAEKLESLDLEKELSFNQESLIQNFLFMADMIYFQLNREFLNFDFEKQKDLFKFLNLKGKGKYLKLLVLAIVLVVFLSIILIFFIYRQRRPKLKEIEKSLSLIEEALMAKGMSIPVWWGPLRWQREIISHFPALEDDILLFCRLWIELSYQDLSLKGDDRIDLKIFKAQAKLIQRHVNEI